jgi:hypothetical protein
MVVTRCAVLSAAAMPRLAGFVDKTCAVQLKRDRGGGGFLGGGSFLSSVLAWRRHWRGMLMRCR